MDTEMTQNKNGSLTYKKTESKKQPGRKPVYIHKCSEKVQLERMRIILVGNGDPKSGLAFKMEQSISDITDIKKDIATIKEKLEAALTGASAAASSLEKYKIEVASFDAGKNDVAEKQKIADDLRTTKERESWQRVIWVIMAVIAFIGLGINTYYNIKGNKKQDIIKEEVRNLGTPYITNPRGVLVDSVKVKMWPNDFLNDSVK